MSCAADEPQSVSRANVYRPRTRFPARQSAWQKKLTCVCCLPCCAKMRLAGEIFCRESTSSNASQLAAAGRCFPSPATPKATTTRTSIADGRYYVEWYVGGTRRRVSAGVTAAQVLEVQRRKNHELEGRKLGIPVFETVGKTVKKPALHVAIAKYLEQIAALKNPLKANMKPCQPLREFFRDCVSIDAISGDDLTRFVVTVKKDHGLGSNTILHNAVIVAPFLKRHGRSGNHARTVATGAHHAACEGIPPRGACPLLCGVLRCGTCLVRHVSADRFPRAGGDVPALERLELRVANCSRDLKTGTGPSSSSSLSQEPIRSCHPRSH